MWLSATSWIKLREQDSSSWCEKERGERPPSSIWKICCKWPLVEIKKTGEWNHLFLTHLYQWPTCTHWSYPARPIAQKSHLARRYVVHSVCSILYEYPPYLVKKRSKGVADIYWSLLQGRQLGLTRLIIASHDIGFRHIEKIYQAQLAILLAAPLLESLIQRRKFDQ